MAWAWLAGAVVFEVGWVFALEWSGQRVWSGKFGVFVLLYALSALCMMAAMRDLPMGLTYAVWVGAGALIVGVIEMRLGWAPVSALRVLFLLMIVAGVAGLNATTPARKPPAAGAAGGTPITTRP